MKRPFWQFVFESNLVQALQDERLKGLVLNDLLNNTRRLFLRKQENQQKQAEANPETLLAAELENV